MTPSEETAATLWKIVRGQRLIIKSRNAQIACLKWLLQEQRQLLSESDHASHARVCGVGHDRKGETQ